MILSILSSGCVLTKKQKIAELAGIFIYTKEIFNGQIVRELTGLTDRELGKFMQYIKLKIPKREILVNMLPEQVAALVNAEYEEYKKNNC